jgi:branched-chain amino acid transport system permease protein
VSATFYLSARLPFAAAVPAAMVVTGAVGLLIERVLRPLENKDFDLMLIGTIGAGTVLEAAAILIWTSAGRGVPSPVRTAPLVLGGVRIPPYDLLVIGITAISMVTLALFLQRTKPGAAMQAVAMDHEAATAAGIHVGRSNAIAFGIGAALAALAGSLAGPMLYVSPTMGDSLGIQGFASAVLGGFGSIPGAIAGGLGIGVIGAFAAQSFQGYSDLVTFVVFTVLVMIRPTGIFGEKTVNRA